MGGFRIVANPKRRRGKHWEFVESQRHRYDVLFEAQGGGCFLCGSTPKTRKLHIDHDHARMVVRGLLCFRCNAALKGWMTRDWLLKAADYVERQA
jgi:hypothetical protein